MAIEIPGHAIANYTNKATGWSYCCAWRDMPQTVKDEGVKGDLVTFSKNNGKTISSIVTRTDGNQVIEARWSDA